ncbi:MAG: hypothetical protein RLZ53_683, partial [Actinomycetota bacterium]
AAEMAARGRSALVFRGSDGLDELTTTGISKIWQVSGGEVQESEFDPASLGIARAALSDLLGGDPQHNAHVAKSLFENQADGPVADIVKLNAAAGLVAFELAKNPSLVGTSLDSRFTNAFQKVTIALESGAAAEKLSQWMAATQA